MIALDIFLPEIRPWAPGVPDAIAFKAIRGSAVEFCERTRLWKYEDAYDITLADCEGVFTPTGSILHDFDVVLFDGRELLPRAARDLDKLIPKWRTGEELGGIPTYITQIELDTMRIVPPLAGHLNLCLTLKPDPNATELPDFLAEQYREIIGWGALGRLLTIPGQSYSSPDLAQYYMGLFLQKIDRLSTKGTTGQQNAPKRTRARFF